MFGLQCDTAVKYCPQPFVQFGTGNKVGQKSLLRVHKIVMRDIEAVSIMTGPGTTGDWHFSDIDGTFFIYCIA